MQISKIANAASDFAKNTGRKIMNNKPDGAKVSNRLRRVNNFLEGESFNPGRGAYYFLMGGCVIVPRLIQAREPDEFREILTRDTVTVLTILFAMKGLKSGMCAAAQKKVGMTLVNDSMKGQGKFKRLLGYLNPDGGISALSSQEILARYSGIHTKDTLVNTLETIDKEGGSVAKMFNIENKKGAIQRAKEKLFNKEQGTPLYDAAKKMFGDDFTSKSNRELIDTVKGITGESGRALEGLEEIVGSNAVSHTLDEGAEGFKRGILNDKKNPLTYYARNLASNFEWLSLGITAGFLGFGLPKFNEKLTKKKHMNHPVLNSANCQQNHVPAHITPDTPALGNIKSKEAFKSFIA